ncbi:calcium-binding protein [Kingella negevensis]|uniref:calcium-binding protein n=1 Tax=Kingella negevensis TaxID=1522312 RepID=UPI00254C2404|nr:calcium-binding protein [Kingella negevensis]MDK4679922.1 calcium-binding protein [Kingella negevensis]MDK4682359.1 calcium-binding protein [Kingella negevensis]MDK4690556.1 calcium-binding protein [Kingella negevensis]MDK4692096.1 calcium-binding protein [Kingella negevensis]MDK4698400.1 calcium-binding protein [Kingella negevensis]
MLWPTWNESRSNMLPGSEPLFPYGDDSYQCLKPWVEQPPRTNKAHGYDPLILNLDGNGIQTIAPSSISARFDHNADGIATATGWAAAGNGILALDLDKNGKIDSGKEIFGNHSVLSNGATAAHGYAALAELDSNHDNLINQADELFSSLKVWQDINQDGISQSNELFTLQALGIQSLNLEHQENSKDLGNGNRLTHIGSYTKTDGTTGEMGDVEFAANSLYSRYTDTVELTPEQLQAPNLQGLGRLRDLREAAALNAELADTLKTYAAAQTKEEQTALLSELVTKWGATDPFKSKTDAFTLSSDLILTDNEGIGLTPTQIAEWRKGIVLDAQTKADFEAVRSKIAVLDAFTGEKSETLYFGTQAQARQIIDTVNQTYDSLANNIYQGLLFQTRLQPYLNEIGFKLDDKQQFTLDYTDVQTKFQETFATNAQKAFVDLGEFLAFGSAKDWTAGMSLLSDFAKQGKESGQLQDWLNVLGDKAATILAEQNGDAANNVLQAVGLLGRDVLNGNGGDDRLIVGSATAVVNGGNGSDVYEFNKGFGATTIYNSDTSDKRHDVVRLNGVSKDAISYKRNGNDLIIRVSGEQNSITVSNMFAGDVLTQHIDAIEYDGGQISLAEIKETLLRGTDGNDFLQGYGDDDTVHAVAGNDRIETYNGNDTIYAGLGDDNIDAGGGNDRIYLETGNNRAYGGDGDDTIVSGSLNDILEGGMGSDTYIFGKQFGQDTVLNFNPHQHDKDVLKFTHTRLDDVIIHRNEADLLITQQDGQQVTVQNFFEKDGKGDYTVQSIEFADGQQLNTEQLRQWVISPTRGDDKLYAYTDGGKLHGGSGNDTLIGNVGVDYLVGGWGNDTLSGGQNDDRLEGGVGNDTYTFNLGNGNDRIYDSFGNDTLLLGSGIAKQDLWFSRNGRDLTVQVLGQTDSVTVEDWFGIIPRRIETIQTHDGSHLDVSAVQKLVQAMAAFAPQQGSGLGIPEQMKEYAQQVFAANNL